MAANDLPARWLERAVQLAPYAPAAAEAFRRAAAELEAERSTDVVTVTPTEAAAVTHYHPESICRLIRTGKVTNYGTKHRPRVRLDELPRKAAASATPETVEPPKPPRHVAGSIGTASDIARDALAERMGRRRG